MKTCQNCIHSNTHSEYVYCHHHSQLCKRTSTPDCFTPMESTTPICESCGNRTTKNIWGHFICCACGHVNGKQAPIRTQILDCLTTELDALEAYIDDPKFCTLILNLARTSVELLKTEPPTSTMPK